MKPPNIGNRRLKPARNEQTGLQASLAKPAASAVRRAAEQIVDDKYRADLRLDRIARVEAIIHRELAKG